MCASRWGGTTAIPRRRRGTIYSPARETMTVDVELTELDEHNQPIAPISSSDSRVLPKLAVA